MDTESFPTLDPVLHAPARLKVMLLMASTASPTFQQLARDAGLTAGNLAAHLKTLESAGYVEATRGIVDLRPRMRYRVTEEGRRALRAYGDALARMVRDLERVAQPQEEGL